MTEALDNSKSPPSQSDPFTVAEAKLARFLRENQPEQSAGLLKQAAEAECINQSIAVASDPDIFRAVLAMKAVQAQPP